MKRIIPLLSILFFTFQAIGQQGQAAQADILIQLETGHDVRAFLTKANAVLSSSLVLKKAIAPRFGLYLLSVERGAAEENLLPILENFPEIISAQYDSPVEFRDSIPNDPIWPDQWNMERIGLPAVWEFSTGGMTADTHQIVAAILDSSFDITHNDLQGNIWENEKEVNGVMGQDDDGNGLVDDFHGWNFIKNSNDLTGITVNGHGTAVSGIVGGKGNNGLGVTGVNWDVKLMFITVDQVSEVVAGFNYALEQRELYNATGGKEGAFVVVTNGSFGRNQEFCDKQPVWGAMYDLLGQVGVVSVAATANYNWDVDELGDVPTTCPSDFLIAVTNTDTLDEKVVKAAYGATSIDLGAPGVGTTSLYLNNNFNFNFGGTSAASPHVAGTVALLYSLPCLELHEAALSDPAATALMMRNAIVQNAFPIPTLHGKTVSGGRLDAFESLKHVHAWCIGTTEDRSAGQVKEVYLGERGLVRLSPNPVSETLAVDFAALDFGKHVSFRVFNALGQEITVPEAGVALPFEKQRITIDVSDWASGFYVVNITDRTFKLSLPFIKI